MLTRIIVIFAFIVLDWSFRFFPCSIWVLATWSTFADAGFEAPLRRIAAREGQAAIAPEARPRLRFVCQPQEGQRHACEADAEFLQRPASSEGLGDVFSQIIEL